MSTEINEPRHEDVEELLGAYALDAVPEDERQMVEEHLALCQVCRNEAREHQETAAMLSGGAAAPLGVWDRIATALEVSAPASLQAARGARAPRKIGRWATGIAAAAAVAAIVVLGLRVVEQDRLLDRVAGVTEEQALARAAGAALRDPEARRVTLRSPDGALSVEGVLLPDGKGYLVRHNLRPLSPDRTYQLWALGDAPPISAGVLGSDPGVVAFSVDPRVGGLAITEEDAGGVVSSENDPLAVGELQSA
ncbi:MAG: anti-sigma factor domain-containing protein [Actinomycetota bacterium]